MKKNCHFFFVRYEKKVCDYLIIIWREFFNAYSCEYSRTHDEEQAKSFWRLTTRNWLKCCYNYVLLHIQYSRWNAMHFTVMIFFFALLFWALVRCCCFFEDQAKRIPSCQVIIQSYIPNVWFNLCCAKNNARTFIYH